MGLPENVRVVFQVAFGLGFIGYECLICVFQVALLPLILLRQHPAEADHGDGGEKKAGYGGDGYAVSDYAPAGAPENDVFGDGAKLGHG